MSVNEELIERLYDKITAEQEEYREYLLSLPADEVLEHAYEYIIREDIVAAFEDVSLTPMQAKALLRQKKPIKEIFEKWRDVETNHMDFIRDTIETRADELAHVQSRVR